MFGVRVDVSRTRPFADLSFSNTVGAAGGSVMSGQVSSVPGTWTLQPTSSSALASRAAPTRATSTDASEHTWIATGGGSAHRGLCTSAHTFRPASTRGNAVPGVLDRTVRHARDHLEGVELRDLKVHNEGHHEWCARDIPSPRT